MFKRLKNRFNREGNQHRHRGGKHSHGHCKDSGDVPEDSIRLLEAPEGKKLIVVANSDIKTMEMGLYPGSTVTLIQNDSSERNIIVKVHDQKYVVPKEIAELIYVRNR